VTQPVQIKKVVNGYIVTYSDGLSEVSHVFTCFADVVDFLYRHFDEDKK